jgi:putative flippase GtrA
VPQIDLKVYNATRSHAIEDPSPAVGKQDHPWFKEVLLFGFIGVMGVAVNISVYYGLLQMGWHYTIASLPGWIAGVLAGYGLNRQFTFHSKTKVSRSLPRVVAIYLIQQGICVGGTALLVELAGLGSFVAYVLTIPPGIIFSFLAMRYFGFR